MFKFICKECEKVGFIATPITERNMCERCKCKIEGVSEELLGEEIWPTSDELQVAGYSKYGYIDIYDHELGAVSTEIKENKEAVNYINHKYKYMYKLFRDKYNLNNHHTHLWKNTYDPIFSLVYKIFIDDQDNFDHPYSGLLELEDPDNLYDVWLCIADSLVDADNSKSMTYKTLKHMACRFEPPTTRDFVELIEIINAKGVTYGRQTSKSIASINSYSDFLAEIYSKYILKKKTAKDKQTKEERDAKLKAAEEKRQRKLAKRRK